MPQQPKPQSQASSTPQPAPSSQPEQPPTEPLAQEPPKEDRDPKTGQLIVSGKVRRKGDPPLPPPARTVRASPEEREYLEANGWEDLGGDLWRDPMTSGDLRGVRMKVGELPVPKSRGGGMEPLYQTVCPSARWDKPTEVAIQMQRMRDEAGKPEDQLSPLTRLDRLGNKIGEMAKLEQQVANELLNVVNRKMPENDMQVKSELVFVKQAVRAAIQRLRKIDDTTTEAA